MAQLEELELSYNQIGDEGMRSLASGAMAKLKVLDMGGNPGDRATVEEGNAPGRWPNSRTFGLDDNLASPTAQVLIDTPHRTSSGIVFSPHPTALSSSDFGVCH
eukprot:6075309-Prymnesium_polylepis.1